MKMNKERYEILLISEEGVAIVDKKTNEVFYGEFDLINRLQERIDKVINDIEITIQIISEQPSRNIEEDNYILSRLEGFINTLGGKE